ncbi:DNA topoisomerase IV [Gramella lutea]|uniref:DNA topoisomerase IV n=1 Tax=Christiangramia lutea TaxID=1607951 RepID=A0A9X1V3I8_9FLAO|nr:DNA topoisomerase IV [Christiangramia lutea]MCH4823011.1 DNA topoisomerase IV [Christiangramia lutea]
MKKLTALVSLILLSACFNPERNCKDHRTGTYEFESFINGELVTSRFIRNDSLEVEKFMGETDTSTVRWINDCEYILKNTNPEGMAEEKPIHIKILSTTSKGYTFEYGLVGDPKKAKGKVKRVVEN